MPNTTTNTLKTREQLRERLVALANDAKYAHLSDFSAKFDAIKKDHPDIADFLQRPSAD